MKPRDEDESDGLDWLQNWLLVIAIGSCLFMLSNILRVLVTRHP